MDSLIALLSAIFYLFAIGAIVPGLSNKNEIKAKKVLIIAVPALVLHLFLLHDLIHDHAVGQNLSLLNMASLVSFLIALFMSIAMLKTRLWILLPVVYGFSMISILASNFLPSEFITHFEQKPTVLIHITFALFAYATLMIGALYALMLIWLDYKLKSKTAGAVNPNLPPLMRVERQLFRIILVGNGLLTITLISGFLFLDDMFAKGTAHKSFFSALAWLIYTLLLWGHYRRSWRGKKVVWFAITGATLLTLAYFGSRFVKEIILS